MRVNLYKLHPKQTQIRKEAKRFNVLNCGRRWGKSKLAVNLLAEPALEGYPVGYFTPTYKLLYEQFQDLSFRLHEVIKSQSKTDKVIELITGGQIEFWTLDDPNAGRSRKYIRAVIDEGAFARYLEEAWLQSIRPTLTDMKGDAWFMSTPKGRNYWHTLTEISKERDNWQGWTMPTDTNPYIDKEEIESAKLDMPGFEFRQEYLAEFADNELNPFEFDYIRAALVQKLSNKTTQFYGIDVAFKNDWTVIIGLDEDGHMSHYQRFKKPLPETERIIKETVKDSRAIMDATGLGQSMYQNLRSKCLGLKGMTYTSGKGDNSKYRLINGLIVALQSYDIKVLESEVSNELFNFTYIYGANGDVKYEAPSGLHDDCVNALALAVKSRNLAPVYQPFRLGDDLIE
jgi:hypothetical protein